MEKGKFDRLVQECILLGSGAKKLESNPYSKQSQIIQFHAWSVGHFDKWGRV